MITKLIFLIQSYVLNKSKVGITMSSTPTFVINPVTKRKININCKVFKDLLKNGYIYDGTQLILPTHMHNVMGLPEILLQILNT